jgi:hypothetical protein
MRINISAAAVLLAVPAALAFQPTALRLPVMTSKSSSVVRAGPSSLMMLKRNKFTPLLMSASDDAAVEEELESPAPTGGGTASIPNEVFNLVKSIVGAGVLSLPAGIAAFGNAPSAIIPAVALICIIGGFSAYGFSLIGRVCSYTGGLSYRGAWSESVGEETSWIPGE